MTMGSNENHFLDHPDVIVLTNEILPELIDESDRGAVIIGADVVDSQLRRLLEKLMTKNVSNGMKKRLFDYSGPLGTFSSKIDVAFAFGYISDRTNNSAQALRRIRNNAAHSNKNFNLKDNSESLRNMYDLGDSLPLALNRWASEFLINNFIRTVIDIKINGKPIFTTPRDVLDYISANPELMKPMEDKRPRMEFSLGLVLLCAMIIYERDKAVEYNEH